jgi:Hemerythrin HHE cation binding domain
MSTDSPSSSGVSAGFRAVAEEHATIKQLVEALTTTKDLGEIDRLLTRLSTCLQDHFAMEEAPRGLIQSLAEKNPAVADRLRKDHERLRATLASTHQDALACLSGPVASVLGRVRELAESILEHEAVESEQLATTLYTDLGGGG